MMTRKKETRPRQIRRTNENDRGALANVVDGLRSHSYRIRGT